MSNYHDILVLSGPTSGDVIELKNGFPWGYFRKMARETSTEIICLHRDGHGVREILIFTPDGRIGKHCDALGVLVSAAISGHEPISYIYSESFDFGVLDDELQHFKKYGPPSYWPDRLRVPL